MKAILLESDLFQYCMGNKTAAIWCMVVHKCGNKSMPYHLLTWNRINMVFDEVNLFKPWCPKCKMVFELEIEIIEDPMRGEVDEAMYSLEKIPRKNVLVVK